jgi:thiazole synthase ThiGH ThiG subunit
MQSIMGTGTPPAAHSSTGALRLAMVDMTPVCTQRQHTTNQKVAHQWWEHTYLIMRNQSTGIVAQRVAVVGIKIARQSTTSLVAVEVKLSLKTTMPQPLAFQGSQLFHNNLVEQLFRLDLAHLTHK